MQLDPGLGGPGRLGPDPGFPGSDRLKTYGGILKSLYRKEFEENLFLERLSEENGVITVKGHSELKTGDKLRIIPNHACQVTNLHDFYYLVQGENVLSKVKVDARGKTT